MNFTIVLTTFLAYLVGSVPVGVLAARLFGWPDPRTHDSGHTGGLNSLRGGGLFAGILVGALDMGKGALAVWLTGLLVTRLAPQTRIPAIALAGAAVVVGHSWSIFIRFRGGMGLSAGAGAGATHVPLVPFIAAVTWGLFQLLTRHRARAVIATALLVPLLMWLLRRDAETLWLGIAVCAVILIRHLPQWNRTFN